MTTCTHHGCDHQARWIHDGRPLCRGHAATELIRTGRPGEQIPAETVDEAIGEVVVALGKAMAAQIDRMWQPGYLPPVPQAVVEPQPFGPQDIVDMLEAEDTDECGNPWVEELKLDAAAEIRRLRARVAELEAGQSAER